jgi:DNA invertase Pin-like site-specific DNA recombinase
VAIFMQNLNPMGRRPFKPTEDDRAKVARMSSMGITQEQIAKVFGITPKTLRKHFRKELDASAIEANFQVTETLFKMATSGTNTAASIFWVKTRCNPRPDPPPKPSVPTPPSTIVILPTEGAR